MPPAWVGSVLNAPFRSLSKKSLPDTAGVFQAAELDEAKSAEILRDQHGVPHIYAATEHDLYFLNGVVHAQDRLWQMHSGRMLAAGRLSEMVGARALDIDRLVRQLGVRVLAEEDATTLDGSAVPGALEARKMMEAYASGVNWYASKASSSRRLPLEFKLTGQQPWEPWTVADSLSLSRFYSFAMNFGFQHSLLRRGLAELFGTEKAAAWTCTTEREDNIPCHVDEAAWEAFTRADLSSVMGMASKLPKGQGSNWWILHGSRTTTGKPLLVGDPHLQIRIPNFWYEVHFQQTTGGADALQVYGVAPPGLPGTLIGHNGCHANSITLAYCDVEDVFLERVRQSDGKYLYKGEWRDCEIRRETIAVKKGSPVECVCRATCHGPLLEGKVLGQHDCFKTAVAEAVKAGCGQDEEILVAYAAIALRRKALSAVSLWRAMHTKSFEEFDSALSFLSKTFSLNFGYADVNGHIGYIMTGEVPRRGGQRGAEQYPLAGWAGQNDWEGFVEHHQLPKAFDPPDGILISANHKVVDYKYYPHYLGQSWKTGYRAQAIQEELSKILRDGALAAPHQMPSMLTNTVSPAAVQFVEELQDVTPSPDTEAAIKILLAWDGDLRSDSVPASLYQLTQAELVKGLVRAGVKSVGATLGKGLWATLDEDLLIETVGGISFDANLALKFLNEFQGHIHLNVLRMLRTARQRNPLPPQEPTGADRMWWLEQAGGRDAAVNDAVRRAVATLRKLGGKDWPRSKAAQWGKIHVANFSHPLTKGLGLPPGSKPFDCKPLPTSGDTNTIQQAATKSIFDLSANSSHASLRICFNMADLSDSSTNRIIMPLGQSGLFVSPHYSDQTQTWLSGKMKPMLQKEAEVRASSTCVMSFSHHPVQRGPSRLARLVSHICGGSSTGPAGSSSAPRAAWAPSSNATESAK